MIFHIAKINDWEAARSKGEYTVASLDADGFIHCSTLRQVIKIANLFFKGQTGLVLLCLDEKKLVSNCLFEKPIGNTGDQYDPGIDELFPHIYGPINTSAVIGIYAFSPNLNGFFELPGVIRNSVEH